MMRKATFLACISTTLLCSQLASQEGDSDANQAANAVVGERPDEIVVRGRRLADFRTELQAARIRVYDLFNELNNDDAFDVRCHLEVSTGTRTRQQVCRPQFKDEISADAAAAWVYGIMDACHSELTQDCIFGNAAAASQARAAALGEEGREPVMQKRFALEMARVVAENPEMQQAILEYQAVERAYEEARGGRSRACDGSTPPARCSR